MGHDGLLTSARFAYTVGQAVQPGNAACPGVCVWSCPPVRRPPPKSPAVVAQTARPPSVSPSPDLRLRPPSILDLVAAVTELAPAHPEVAVWWYRRSAEPGAPPMLLVLQPREGPLDPAPIAAELSRRFGPHRVTVRQHQGPGEPHALYRLLSAEVPAR